MSFAQEITDMVLKSNPNQARDATGKFSAGGSGSDTKSGGSKPTGLSAAQQKEIAGLQNELGKVQAKIIKLKGEEKGEMKTGASTGGASQSSSSTSSSGSSGGSASGGSSSDSKAVTAEITKLQDKAKAIQTQISQIESAAKTLANDIADRSAIKVQQRHGDGSFAVAGHKAETRLLSNGRRAKPLQRANQTDQEVTDDPADR